MPVTIAPVENGQVLKITISDPWTMQQLIDTFPEANKFITSAPGKVHSIIDLLQMKSVPSNALGGRNSPSIVHPNSGYVFVVGASKFAQTLTEVAFKVARYNKVQFFSTMESALEQLHKAMAQEISIK
jgi:hypothetical protein